MRRYCLGKVSQGAVVVLGLALGATVARGGDDARTQVLELNKFTGLEPAQGMLHELSEQPERTKKLIQAGLVLLKEKKLRYTSAIILAHAAADLKEFIACSFRPSPSRANSIRPSSSSTTSSVRTTIGRSASSRAGCSMRQASTTRPPPSMRTSSLASRRTSGSNRQRASSTSFASA